MISIFLLSLQSSHCAHCDCTQTFYNVTISAPPSSPGWSFSFYLFLYTIFLFLLFS